MSHLAHIREQIKTIQTTKKITHAVRLVSMSLYSKLEKKNAHTNTYTTKLAHYFSFIQKNISQHAILNPNKPLTQKPLIIIIATTKGLCGSLNSNLLKFLHQSNYFHNNQHADFIIIGQQALKLIKNFGIKKIIHSYNELNSNNYTSIANDLIDKIIIPTAPYSSVYCYHNEIKNFFVQQPCSFQLIPLIGPELEKNTSEKKFLNSLIWEQSAQEIYSKIGTQYLRALLINKLFQALLAEHAARFLAMDTSTNNAEKFLERLTLDYNKLRQSLITQEVAELTALDTSL